MNTKRDNAAQKILMFDSSYKLCGIFGSYYSAAQITGICHQMIVKACSGKIIAAKNAYWRELAADTIVDCDDIGQLTLIEYDRSQQQNRQIYATKAMRKNEIIFDSDFEKRHSIIKKKQRELWQKQKNKN